MAVIQFGNSPGTHTSNNGTSGANNDMNNNSSSNHNHNVYENEVDQEWNRDNNQLGKVRRMRLATQRQPGASGVRKRVSIMDRFHRRASKIGNRKSAASSQPSSGATTAVGQGEKGEEAGDNNRRVYFNCPIPPEERDEEGKLKAQYPRNKIRTAKYTPLSFIPKNLYFQFHNVAIMYFLFIIILSVRLAFFLMAVW